MIRVLDGRKFDFTLIENDLIDDIERFDKNDLLCYMVLCRYANNSTGECYPSYKTIAEKMRVGVSTAIKAIKSLESKGVIKIHSRKNENGGDTSNLYVIQNINDENKKASTVPPVKAENENIKDNNSIHKNKKKYTKNIKENNGNKVLHNKHNDSVNNNFTNYEEKELESMLREKQKEKFGDVQSFEFNPNFKI
ncbi:MAG TPA: helix-turn-helix domain-containing protein [Romboutsia timonensis]|uniref:Helix-turn-helix domain-containing protein n=1 Tax=Romboutsia timonensis TaxID=1776391 RepID=A0A921MZ34_9FIRM|nr:helix-turn-helix domain-containing protein [Romboutsia timonensis]